MVHICDLLYIISVATISQKISFGDIKSLLMYKKKDRGSVTAIANRLGNPGSTGCEWLKLTPKENMPKPEKVAFPKPPKAPDGSLMYDRIPNKVLESEKFIIPNTIGCTIITPTNLTSPVGNSGPAVGTPLVPTTLKKRAYEMNGLDGNALFLTYFNQKQN